MWTRECWQVRWPARWPVERRGGWRLRPRRLSRGSSQRPAPADYNKGCPLSGEDRGGRTDPRLYCRGARTDALPVKRGGPTKAHPLTSPARSVTRQLVDLAWPIVGLNVLQVLTLAVDTAMCGRLPHPDRVLTALGFATQVVFLLMVAMMGLMVGTVALISRAPRRRRQPAGGARAGPVHHAHGDPRGRDRRGGQPRRRAHRSGPGGVPGRGGRGAGVSAPAAHRYRLLLHEHAPGAGCAVASAIRGCRSRSRCSRTFSTCF